MKLVQWNARNEHRRWIKTCNYKISDSVKMIISKHINAPVKIMIKHVCLG